MAGRCQQPGGKSWAALMDDGDWRTHAVCRLEDADRFTRDTRPDQAELQALAEICSGCPVTAQCAQFALRNRLCGFYAGVWIADTGREVAPARTALRRLAPIPDMDHGTEAGNMQHRRRGERPCRACLAAAARVSRERRNRRRETTT